MTLMYTEVGWLVECLMSSVQDSATVQILKLKETDVYLFQATAGEVRMHSYEIFSYGLQHMDTPVTPNQQRLTNISGLSRSDER